jgi:hypothetical protein
MLIALLHQMTGMKMEEDSNILVNRNWACRQSCL